MPERCPFSMFTAAGKFPPHRPCSCGVSGSAAELGATLVGCLASQLLFDTQQLVVLGHAVRAAQRARLDLACGSTHGQVGDGAVLGFTTTVRDHLGEASGLGHLD